mmetsp:Transcript_26404/g.49074  ORF Transcript_26404/g.49074 Transcript_26404/m.49074 type:complete len:311 (-) Transcript_26404:61-993(-)|eukprot:CAMPEP_0197443206 /NCGR_PEP_ID=MMETSP1175-20131217/9007_1 /TAXON_ID=1003142 /ORGANISM="Triceratium dubium, Strain CCMP147" /LENGTH=310 /DNA_ID=CAMNT_0042973803 /DNA_START=128 /DNA_END=1060 /DNA_ORIENTATION=+
MARGQEAKSKRKAARKEARSAAAEELLSQNVNEFDQPPEEEEGDKADETPEMPLPPGMAKPPSASEDSSDDSDDDTPATRKKSRSGKSSSRKAPPVTAKKKEGIKTLPLVMLIMLTGTTVLPALLFLGDKMGAFIQKKHLMGNIGHRLGIGPSPKKRVLSFYEKHDPTKIEEVPTILAKYYGDYPKLTKRLERKYNDYGYFLNWEEDEAPMTLAFDQLRDTGDKIQEQWNKYAPQFAKTGARNMKHNFTFLYKKVRAVWKKKVWPVIEPYFGVPDAKAARAQKRKDAQAANAAKPGRRKKNTEYRDDPDE